MEWTGEDDLGWHLDPGQRRAQATHGYHHGPIRALVDQWESEAEPSYSVAAIAAINAMMSAGFRTVSFADIAARYAGQAGTDLIARIRAMVVDDLAEPDPAPSASDDLTTDGAAERRATETDKGSGQPDGEPESASPEDEGGA